MIIVSVVMLVLTILNIVFGRVLYQEPSDENYFHNVGPFQFSKEKIILPEPRYVLLVSIATGLMLGAYIALAECFLVPKLLKNIVVCMITIWYFIEITRKITLQEQQLTLSCWFAPKRVIPVSNIQGAYVYSYNKKFLKQHALTTKLVLALKDGKKVKFILSSISNKKVFHMLKDNFNVTSHKLFIQKHESEIK